MIVGILSIAFIACVLESSWAMDNNMKGYFEECYGQTYRNINL